MTAIGTTTLDTGEDPQRILAERARALAVPPDQTRASIELHLVLRVGDHRVGLPAARARHVSGPRPLTTVPAAPRAIVGTAPVLGELVAVADLGTLLGVAADRPEDQRHLVVVDDDHDALGLLVDDVEDLVDVDVALVGAGDHTVGQLTRTVTGGLRLLDIDALLADPRLSRTATSSTDPARGES